MSPDGSPKPPPEEKLLRLIREKSLRPAVAVASVAPAGPAPSIGFVRQVPRSAQWPWLQALVAVLAVLLAAEAGWLIWQVLQPATSPATAALQLPVTLTSVEAPAAPPMELPSLAASATRSLFVAPVAQASASEGSPRPAARAASAAAKELAVRLSLNGIMGGDPAQAIIEDTVSKKTYFVTPGQSVADGAVVEEVSEAQKRVILDLDGERIELTL
jgi:hypothetical protein